MSPDELPTAIDHRPTSAPDGPTFLMQVELVDVLSHLAPPSGSGAAEVLQLTAHDFYEVAKRQPLLLATFMTRWCARCAELRGRRPTLYYRHRTAALPTPSLSFGRLRSTPIPPLRFRSTLPYARVHWCAELSQQLSRAAGLLRRLQPAIPIVLATVDVSEPATAKWAINSESISSFPVGKVYYFGQHVGTCESMLTAAAWLDHLTWSRRPHSAFLTHPLPRPQQRSTPH